MEHTIELEATVRARLDDACDALSRRTTRAPTAWTLRDQA